MQHELDALSATLGRHYYLALDGGSAPNPGRGGWACVKQLRDGSHVVQEAVLSGAALYSTNNEMELTAAARGIGSLLQRDCPVLLLTDSEYLRRGVTEWSPKWKANGWRTAERKPVKNRELWEELDLLTTGLDARWGWIAGHSGHPLNERADAAVRAVRSNPKVCPSPPKAFLSHGFTPE